MLINSREPDSIEDIFSQIIWNNRFICLNKFSAFNRNIWNLGINTIRDLYGFQGNLNTAVLNNLFPMDRLALKGILSCIPNHCRSIIKRNSNLVLHQTNSSSYMIRIDGKLIDVDKNYLQHCLLGINQSYNSATVKYVILRNKFCRKDLITGPCQQNAV